MPGKNVIKHYEVGGYYHVYNRGVNKGLIFIDEYDYKVFLNLFKRHLDVQSHHDKKGRPYPWLRDDVDLLAYCLMPNHFHALVRQNKDRGVTQLLQCMLTSYVTYFNKRHQRVGRLFQGPFKAAHVTNDAYLLHITRYIHLNPRDYQNWPYSSYSAYLRGTGSGWLLPSPILSMFGDEDYGQFVADYEDSKRTLDSIKHELADC